MALVAVVLGVPVDDGHQVGCICERLAAEKPNYWHRRLLRPRRQRPRSRAAKPCNEFPPPHVHPRAQEGHRIGSNEHFDRG